MRRAAGRRFRVGALGIAACLLLGYLAFTKDIPFTRGYQVDAVFTSSNGLRPGSPVRIAGVHAGKVEALGRGPGRTARVTLSIEDEARPVHRDATLKIRPRMFLEGGFFVEMRPGSPSAPELQDGDTIGLPQTAVPVQFHQILTAFQRPTRDSLRDVFDELARALDGGGAEALGRAARPAAPALRDLAVVAEAARGEHPRDASDLVRHTGRVTAALARRDGALASLVTNLSRTTAALAREEAALAAGVRELDGALGEAPGALAAVDRALGPTRAFAADLRPALGPAPGALRSAATFLDELDALNRPRVLPRLLDRLEPTLTVLPTLERRLDDLFGRVTPVTDCVRDRAVPVLRAELDDGALSTGRPVWQDLAHAAVGLASGSQSFDANGPWVRYQFGVGTESVSTGAIPGVGQLFGNAPNPVLGTRPTPLPPGATPPLRPQAPCREQAAPDLRARTGGGTAMRRAPRAQGPAPRLTPPGLRRAVRGLRGAGR